MNKTLLRNWALSVCLFLTITSCSDEDNNFEQSASTFKASLIEVVAEGDAEGIYPRFYSPTLVLEDLPDGETILELGFYYSPESQTPDASDYGYTFDTSTDEKLQQWDWSQEGYTLNLLDISQLIPGKTYYYRAWVRTNKGKYYTNTVELRSEYTAPLADDPEAYEIPVVFHLFPDEEGNYGKEYQLIEMLEYANLLYSHYYDIPGQADAHIRFVPATTAPDGSALETPGIVYETEHVLIIGDPIPDGNTIVDQGFIKEGFSPEFNRDKHLWDTERVLNVFVCEANEEYAGFAGISTYPFFDREELLPGGYVYKPDCYAYIALNKAVLNISGYKSTFAHEVGHILGLYHAFESDYCDDTPWYDREEYLATRTGYKYTRIDAEGNTFRSDNIMDYFDTYATGVTPDQVERIRYTLEHAYFIPGEAGKEAPDERPGESS